MNTFFANGNRYYILTDNDAFPIARWTLYGKFTQMYLSGQEFQSMYNQFDLIEKDLDAYTKGKGGFTDVAVRVRAAKEHLKEFSKTRYDAGLYIATLFIVRDGENINEWKQAEADDKIQDWATEGYRVMDFLELAGKMLLAYQDALRRSAESLMTGEMEAALSDHSASPATDTNE